MEPNNILLVLASALLSLLFFYVPGFKDWYDKQQSSTKQLIMVGAIFVIAAGQYGYMLYQNEVIFSVDSVLEQLAVFVVALATNAGIYRSVNRIGKSAGV